MATNSFFGVSAVSRTLTLAVATALGLTAVMTTSGCGPSEPDAATGGGGNGGSAPVCEAPADSKPTVMLTKIGMPTWEFVDYHQFSATCGQNYDQLGTTAAMILPPPNHKLHPMLGIGPGDAHAGPYDHEFKDGLTTLNLVDHMVFAAVDATWPKCIFATWMIVPTADAPMGSSPDSMTGPIIPNTLFPIHSSMQGYLDDQKNPADPYEFDIPALDGSLDPPFTVDGHSHIPMFYYEDTNTLLKDCGKHEFRGSLVDKSGNGWEFVTTFHLGG